MVHATHPSPSHATHVLVLEDDRLDQEIMRQACATLGWTLDVAATPADAVRAATQRPPRLVVVDVSVLTHHRVDPVQFAAQLRQAAPQRLILAAWSYAPPLAPRAMRPWWDRWIIKSTDAPDRASAALVRIFRAMTLP